MKKVSFQRSKVYDELNQRVKLVKIRGVNMGHNGQLASNNDSYFESMIETMMNNYRPLIDCESRSVENKDYTVHGNSFYTNLVYRFLSNFSTIN